jgi:hypothetical protein
LHVGVIDDGVRGKRHLEAFNWPMGGRGSGGRSVYPRRPDSELGRCRAGEEIRQVTAVPT